MYYYIASAIFWCAAVWVGEQKVPVKNFGFMDALPLILSWLAAGFLFGRGLYVEFH